MKHWVQAARLRTLPLSLSGIITGSFLAASKGVFHWEICVLALLTTVGFQVLSNFANDYGDGVKGSDKHRTGEARMVSSGKITPKQMKLAVVVTSVITLIIALLLIYVSFGKENFAYSLLFFVLGIASIVAAIKYTVGKKAYGYSGFGDIFVFLFFGLLGVVGCEFLYTQKIDILSFLPAVSIGVFSVAVLNLNNMRDRLSDIQSSKNTLVVKLGAKKAKVYHYILFAVGMLSAVSYVVTQEYSYKAYLFVISFLPMIKHLQTVISNKEAVLLDPELKKVALSTFLFAVLFGLGLII